MKTAISLSDKLFHDADALAKELNISRSELYATALEEYLARRDREQITARLNAVYRPLTERGPETGTAVRRPASREERW